MMPTRLMKLAKMRGLVGVNGRHRRGMGPPMLGSAFIQQHATPRIIITGITKDSGGAPIGGCTVKLYRTSDDVMVLSTISDGSGNYTFAPVNRGVQYYVVAYKAGAPDVSGTTLNTLEGEAS